VVDLNPAHDAELLAANLVQELAANDGHSEVGYLARRRVVLKTRVSELETGGKEQFTLEPGSPLIVTGGARGITATITQDLARLWKPRLLVIGSSPAPHPEEDGSTFGITAPADLKAALHQQMAALGRTIQPADLERAYQSLCRQREMRTNLAAFRAAGAEVEYAQADVRDADALRQLLTDWRGRFGPFAGLIHGAGVIQDKLLRDKTPESFDRVLGTKLDGALNLAALLDSDPLRFAAFFSSVAGRFGNSGQADYAAANDALNKLAIWLDRRWAGRVVSIIWGPWSGVGMVSDLEAHLGRRGLGMISPQAGRSLLTDELRHGRKGDVEVILAGDIAPLAALSDDTPHASDQSEVTTDGTLSC
jgi:NAD(P)-dependent dehydrogenase (short-subunit alcohol dehydrogenase family)